MKSIINWCSVYFTLVSLYFMGKINASACILTERLCSVMGGSYKKYQYYYYYCRQVKGKTKSAEVGQSKQSVHIFWTERLRQISLRSTHPYVNETMVMAVDRQEASARSEFEIALEIISKKNTQGHYELLRSHTDAWKAVWSQGLIEVDGNIQVCGG